MVRTWFEVTLDAGKAQTQDTLKTAFAQAGFDPARPRHSMESMGCEFGGGISYYPNENGASIYVTLDEAFAIAAQDYDLRSEGYGQVPRPAPVVAQPIPSGGVRQTLNNILSWIRLRL